MGCSYLCSGHRSLTHGFLCFPPNVKAWAQLPEVWLEENKSRPMNSADISSGDAITGVGSIGKCCVLLREGVAFSTEIVKKERRGWNTAWNRKKKNKRERKKNSWKLARKTMGSDIPLIFLSADNSRPQSATCVHTLLSCVLMYLCLCLILSDQGNWFMAAHSCRWWFALSCYENISCAMLMEKTIPSHIVGANLGDPVLVPKWLSSHGEVRDMREINRWKVR